MTRGHQIVSTDRKFLKRTSWRVCIAISMFILGPAAILLGGCDDTKRVTTSDGAAIVTRDAQVATTPDSAHSDASYADGDANETCTVVRMPRPQMTALVSQADSYVMAASPDANFGLAEGLNVGNSEDGSPIMALIRFSIFGPCRRYDRVDRALIRIPLQNGDGENLLMTQAIGPWQEAAVAWRTSPPRHGAWRKPVFVSADHVVFDVTDWAIDWNADSTANFGVVLRNATELDEPIRLSSRESEGTGPQLELVVNAAIAEIFVDADTHLDPFAADANFGDSATLLARRGGDQDAATSVLLHWPLSAVSKESTIFFARLKLVTINDDNDTRVSWKPIEEAWSEEQASWQNRPATGEDITPQSLMPQLNGRSLILDLTAQVQSWAADRASNFGITLQRKLVEDTSPQVLYGSSENPDPLVRPVVTIYHSGP